jgi:hypothetical protein
MRFMKMTGILCHRAMGFTDRGIRARYSAGIFTALFFWQYKRF